MIEPEVIPMQGKLSVTRTQSNERDDYMSLQLITDDNVVRVDMEPHDFALALTGKAEQPCRVREVKGESRQRMIERHKREIMLGKVLSLLFDIRDLVGGESAEPDLDIARMSDMAAEGIKLITGGSPSQERPQHLS